MSVLTYNQSGGIYHAKIGVQLRRVTSDHIRPTYFRYLSTKQPSLIDGTETICIDSVCLFVCSWAMTLAQVSNLREKNLDVHSMSRNYHHNFVWPNCTSPTYTTETSQTHMHALHHLHARKSKYVNPDPWDDAKCHKSWWFTNQGGRLQEHPNSKRQEKRSCSNFKSSQFDVAVVTFGLGLMFRV